MIFLILWCQDWFKLKHKKFLIIYLTSFYETWKVLCRMHVFKGTIFCCVRSCRRKFYTICYFSYRMSFLFNVIFFFWKKSKRSKNCITYSEESNLWTCQNCKFNKRQSHACYTFLKCLLITNSILTEKRFMFRNVSQNLNLKFVIFLWKIQV